MLYGSKKIVAEVRNEKDWHIAWSSKIVHDIGASFIENGSSNNPLFDQINLNVGFIRNEFRFDSGFNYNVKIKPVSLITTVYSSIGNKFDLSLSLTYGTPLFIRDDNDLPNALGITHVNSIVLRESFANDFGLIKHEIIHVFQFDEYAGLNSFMGPQTRKWKRNKAYRKVSDIFYFEFHSVIYYSFYFTDELIQGRLFNFLEQEAYNFADPFRN